MWTDNKHWQRQWVLKTLDILGLLGTLSKRERRRQRREARKLFLPNPRVLLSTSLLWLPCMFLFSLKFRWLQRLFLNETLDVSSWNVGHVLKTAWKWSSWSLIWEQDGRNVSFISHIHVRFLSGVISFIVLPTLPSPSSAVCLRSLFLWKWHSAVAGPLIKLQFVCLNFLCLSLQSLGLQVWCVNISYLSSWLVSKSNFGDNYSCNLKQDTCFWKGRYRQINSASEYSVSFFPFSLNKTKTKKEKK